MCQLKSNWWKLEWKNDWQYKGCKMLKPKQKKNSGKIKTSYPMNCVILGDSIPNGVLGKGTLNERPVKVRIFPKVNAKVLQHHDLSIIPKKQKLIILYWLNRTSEYWSNLSQFITPNGKKKRTYSQKIIRFSYKRIFPAFDEWLLIKP